MSANPNNLYMTKVEYLEFLSKSTEKYEYINGWVKPLHGEVEDHVPSFVHINHNHITMSLSYLIYASLIGKNCTPFGGDQRLEIEKLDVYFFPDLSVVCGDVEFTEDSLPAIIDPVLIIEMLSPSTELYDRTKKFQMYRQIDSLREYVLVSQESARIERFYLNTQGIWEFIDAAGLESSIMLKSIDCNLSLSDVYANVTFEDVDNS